ncbi:hypothetical protein IU459_27205 [Nocardia amamiensis]|uniref:Uncharacterized protein n=1 Tax=Nocardia amamiensis TaxID=404578 RepID=A0ABS0CYI4_9NOCA|nr:hypothetical protein [Nocardia amamiensis]MBF6301205.1 hypothetical protein [Nocardia amamiensis]
MIAGPGYRWWTPLASDAAAWSATAGLAAGWVAYLAGWVSVGTFVVWAGVTLAAAVLMWTARLAVVARRWLVRTGRRWP